MNPNIQTSKGFSGKNFNYQGSKPKLRLYKSEDSSRNRNPNSFAPCPNVDSCLKREIKSRKGEKAGDAFVESNNGGLQYVKNIGKRPAILHVDVVSVVGMPTTINK